MKSRRNDAAMEELMAKGFCRAKCAQALKDAGNNTSVALRVLEQLQKRQRDASHGQPAGPSPKVGAGLPAAGDAAGNPSSLSPAIATSIPSLLRQPAKNLPPTAAQAALQRQRARRHPCVVQYGSCQYGDHCALRDFPGDVCVQHSQGSCIYGSACRHRHTVDGVDVRDVVRSARVGAAYFMEEDGEKGDALPSPPPHHLDPYMDKPDDISDDAPPPSHHPTPFRDLVAAGPSSALPPAQKVTTTILETPSATRSVGRHPCVAQYGSCKYGAACLYADRDADVCIHFLAGRCRYSAEDCTYRHETAEEYQRTLRARAGLGEFAKNATTAATAAAPTTAPRRTKARLQGGAAARVQHSPSPATASPLPSCEDMSALIGSEAQTEETMENGATAGGDVSDAETRVFLGLVEAYPFVEPAVVLQALRLCGNDPIAASDMMQQFATSSSSTWSSADVDSVAAALAVAAAEDAAEKEATAAAAQHAKSMERHNALLTLLMLFPGAEVAAAEAVLTAQKGDFAAAYGVLLCVQERVAQQALWQGSTATLTPADTLRVEKLCAMFPGLHHEIIRSAFCATQRDWTATTTALNELTKELLELEAVELPAKPVVWQPPSTQEQPRQQPARLHGATPTAAESNEAAQAAYRAAEKEILSYGDWRQVRQQAYLINDQRIRVLSQATAAFHKGDGRTAKLLSREGQRMAVEYNRLNRLAMLALEQERLRSDAASTLDLHGFHTAEVHDVLVRRVVVCQRKRIGRLRIVVGEGLHSKRGHCSLYTTVMEELRMDAYLKSAVKVKSIKAGYVDVAVHFSAVDE